MAIATNKSWRGYSTNLRHRFKRFYLESLLATFCWAATTSQNFSFSRIKSPEGQQLLNQSKSKQDFQPLSTHIETQKRPAYCGVASSVMVLNALGSKKQGYRTLTQDTFLTVKPRASVLRMPSLFRA